MEYYKPFKPFPGHSLYFQINTETKTVYVGTYRLEGNSSFSLYGEYFSDVSDLLRNLHLFEHCTRENYPELFI